MRRRQTALGAGRSGRMLAVATTVPLALLLTVAIAGCGTSEVDGRTGGPPGAPSGPRADAAREAVLTASRNISDERTDDINGFARALTADNQAGVILVGIQKRTAATRGDVVGTLTLLVPSQPVAGQDPEQDPYCLDVDFDWYGAAGLSSGGVEPRFVDCPANPTAVTPPIDTSIHLVVSADAADVAVSVLTAAGTTVVDTDIAAAITAKLSQPKGEFEQASPPSVLVEGENIGVSMGGADDCVLVARVDGEVIELHPPRVLLQEGEYGCRPETALTDPELLRSPH